jgi:hypothetical protein
MNRHDLIKRMKELIEKSEIYLDKPFSIDGDPDDWHREADNLLLKYINDEEISELFEKIERWYS